MADGFDAEKFAARINKSTAGLDAAVAAQVEKKTFTKATWPAYHKEQLAKASAETPEVAQQRLAALTKAQEAATAAFATAESFETEVYVEPAVAAAEPPTTVETVTKTVVSLMKALQEDTKLKEAVQKALGTSKGLVTLKKAAADLDPVAMLQKIATIFNIDLAKAQENGNRISWKVEEAVAAVESAARAQLAMQRMNQILSGVQKGATVVPPVKKNKDPEGAARTPTKKGWGTDLGAEARARAAKSTSKEN